MGLLKGATYLIGAEGGRVSWSYLYSIHIAVIKQNLNILRLITTKANINARASNDITPLSLAVQIGSPEIVKFLLDNGARPKPDNFNLVIPNDETATEIHRYLNDSLQESKIQLMGANTLKPPMQVFVKTLTAKTITITTDVTETIERIKERIFEKQAIPVSEQRLIYGGKPLEDHRTLSDYGIGANATLHLVINLRG